MWAVLAQAHSFLFQNLYTYGCSWPFCLQVFPLICNYSLLLSLLSLNFLQHAKFVI